MHRLLTATFTLSALLSAPAMAAEPPASVIDCLKAAVSLAETAESKSLADDARAKVENYLITLESHCEASRFSEAATLMTDIESELKGS